MQYHSKLISTLALAIAAPLTSCNDSITDAPSPALMVVEGYLDSGGYPRVHITTSVIPTKHEQPITDSFIRWGKVTVSDGDTTIILTGAPDYNEFPPFVYRTYEMWGQPGKRYTITAEYKNLSVSSTATMLSPTPIDSIEFAPIAHSDSLCATFLHFTTAADVPAYYVIQTRSITHGTAFRPSMLGAFVAQSPQTHFRMQVYRAESDIDELYTEHPEGLTSCFIEGEQIAVKLCRVPKEIYDFWNAFNNNALFGDNRFVSGYTRLPSNVAGGYGVWSVQASSTIAATVTSRSK